MNGMRRPGRAARALLAVALAAAATVAAHAAAPPDPAPAAAAAPAWRAVPIFGPASLRTLRQRFGREGFAEVLRLNRIDAEHAAGTDTLIVPERPDERRGAGPFVAPAPFPSRIPALDSLAKTLVVAVRIQAFAAYDSGRLVRWGPVSSGGPGAPTRPGRYHVNWKLPVHRSTVDTSWVMPWCVNIDNREGTALHQHPLPGYPASHCCIRLLEDDAHWVYDWVEEWRVSRDGRTVLAPGTPVVLIGTWDFGAPRPWRALPRDPAAASAGGEELARGLQIAAPEALEEKP